MVMKNPMTYHKSRMQCMLTFLPVKIAPALLTLVLSTISVCSSSMAEPSRSTNISLTNTGKILINANTETSSVTVFGVKSNGDVLEKIAEIPVGREPHSVAVLRNNEAYVTNSASSTVSVIGLKGKGKNKVIAEIPVGTEPRGCALTPSGNRLYVANHTAGTVSVIDTSTRTVIDTIEVGGNPTAIAITDDGDKTDDDERVFVTQFFAELIPGGPGEGFDEGKHGIVSTFEVDNPGVVTRMTLSPLADSGFTADRTNFCPQSASTPPHSDIFCPDLNAAPGSDTIIKDPQGAFPNQLQAALIRGNRLYLPNIGAAPEPPVKFDVNVQALVHVVDADTLSELTNLHVNLNAQIKNEPVPSDPTSLDKLFGNDIVAIDANRDGTDFLIVSRGGNYVIRASLDVNGKLDIGAPDNVVRFQVGNIPTGLVMSKDGRRAYVNNEVNASVSILNLANNTVITRDVSSATVPDPGSFAHGVLVGKLVFFTALGVPDNGLSALPIRNIVPLQFRGKQSNNAWSTCASCHPSGLSDGVTWFFADGPRQTIPLDGLYSKISGAHDQRINNWSAVRGSTTDFNNNSRGVQGGIGFASDAPFSSSAPNPNIFNHGVTHGGSEALDLETLWVQTIRPLTMPVHDETHVSAGALVFNTNCANCHGGAKWTKSEVLYRDNPALVGGIPRDPGVTTGTGGQVVSFAVGTDILTFLENIGTFTVANPFEIKANGATAFGELGFNVPSLLGVGYHAPYFHHGAAQTLEDAFALHGFNGGTIESALSALDRDYLIAFLKSVDGKTARFRSEADDFRDPL